MSANNSTGMPKLLVGFFLAGGAIILIRFLVG